MEIVVAQVERPVAKGRTKECGGDIVEGKNKTCPVTADAELPLDSGPISFVEYQ
jgi:hypothetical protein